MSAKSRYFLDTNVLVYTFNTNTRGDIASIANIAKRSKNATDVDDAADLDKQRIATGFVERALDQGGGVISTQVLQEFLNLVTRRHIVMKELDRLRYLDNVLEPLCSVYPTMSLYRNALGIHVQTQYSFYDSLIVAAANEARCEVLYSEVLQHDRLINGTRIVNPFLSSL